MIRLIQTFLCREQTLGELHAKAENSTLTVSEFWLYIEMMTALQKIQGEEKRLARA